MADNSQKTPLGRSLNVFAAKRAQDAIQLAGKALPCSVVSVDGAIVTVNFEVNSPFTLPDVTIPLFGPEYIRYPIQPGDNGVVLPADAYLGGVSGLGGGVADLTLPANLSALVFLPIGNTEWSAVDPQSVTLYGPNGVVLKDTSGATTFVLTPTSITMVSQQSVTATCGGTTMTLTPSGWSLSGASGNMADGTNHTSPQIMNAAWQALVAWLNGHQHTSTTPGSATSTPTSPFTGSSIAPG